MKKKLVEMMSPIPAEKAGWWVTVQILRDILVLNIYENKILSARHCVNIDTGEYATLKHGTWSRERMQKAMGMTSSYLYYFDEKEKEHFRVSEKDAGLIMEKIKHGWRKDPYDCIDYVELEHDRRAREQKEKNRVERVNRLMGRVPATPEGMKEWINQRAIGGEEYATKTEEKDVYACSACGGTGRIKEFKRADGEKRVRHKDRVLCPCCGKELTLMKRKKAVEIWTRFAIIQPIDDDISVARHFDAEIYCGGGRKQIGLDEAMRIILFKDGSGCDLYYSQQGRGNWWVPEGEINRISYFDNKSNHFNRSAGLGYLYDGGIEEAFRGTMYEPWSRLFKEFSQENLKLNYNSMMCIKEENYRNLMELLFRGRFYRLMAENSESVSTFSGRYYGILKLHGKNVEDVFDIGDRQKINRIREKDGGKDMLCWLRWSDRNHRKISDKVLDWLIKNNLQHGDMQWLICRMSLEQGMNYIARQQRESYSGKGVKAVLEQYKDYMDMCDKLNKNTADEMIYRPRELKRRHNEAVAECQAREARLQADEYTKKYPEAEEALRAVCKKYAFSDETYTIRVPEHLVEIVMEGRALHHCVANTDRYFDRIASHETYVCFLRKNEEPETPYYTIEVEPGGTIRQHRGYLDEEPEIDQVKPFLRKWQQEIRKRMTKEDHFHAKISAEKREENIRDLTEKKNTRVLRGLMEDFMEAM